MTAFSFSWHVGRHFCLFRQPVLQAANNNFKGWHAWDHARRNDAKRVVPPLQPELPL